MGITRESRHKRRHTGGKRKVHKKKRKYELGRPGAMTKLGGKVVHLVRGRGNNLKYRALRLETGNFSWGTETCTRKSRILDVTYNASNNELLRTKTLVKGCIVQVDATPFKQWYEAHYGVMVGKKRKGKKKDDEEEKEEVKQSKHTLARLRARQKDRQIDQALEDQFSSGRLYAAVSSRPGQCGRCDGYVLEGKELEFYVRLMKKKGGKK
mmetsp:Transcript_21099/g.25554  ORF Transcript_21099/g.25554 Transcript_21099/m.25554 type:complete len:210 (+) Transcript_21099:157-786(+)|eukprot:CAMPEP_0204835064 /NCGR_PEP_ID=MMETSP1346-20131115/21549_1 /ASSEMBLY_ACC=CAM_ASM_000771 /TAXON_ID=215587 /ORGANISM="Aplanochytrium stocchinoi, Strain GSBS06" /LENGTH=209 /DNA_ID=CAMNT_0051968765 /DNA_START=96 /DNA_END=725 /DNA_ORIENTATION=+